MAFPLPEPFNQKVNAQARTVFFGSQKPVLPDPGGRLPVALVFPGQKRAALSALGWQTVYRLAYKSPWLRVERFFLSPGKDVPRSQDSSSPLDAFPLAAFSLGFELDGAAMANALANSGIPLLAATRPAYPLLLGGGPLAFLNPAPLSPILDAWFVGEAERGLIPCLEEAARLILKGADKDAALAMMAARPGFYVPGQSSLPVKRMVAVMDTPGGHNPADPAESACQSMGQGADQSSVRILGDPAFSSFVSHDAEFRDTLLLEVNRGCPYSCRFCAAGFVYRPPRQARMEDLQDIVHKTGPKKVGLVGTALTDWHDLPAFLHWLDTEKVKFTLSSVRADGITPELLDILRNAGLRTLTLALEAPSARLRAKANKNLDETRFLRAIELAAARGVNHLKVYLIVGWPGETDDDYREFERFASEIRQAGKVGQGKKGVGHLTFGVNPLVPKPWTPMQWAPMSTQQALEERLAQLAALVKPLRGVRIEGEGPFWARTQGLLARGGEDLAALHVLAAEHGWRQAIKEWPGDVGSVLDRERAKDEPFPWECIDIGVSRDILRREWERYTSGKRTPKCPDAGCNACGACGVCGAWPPRLSKGKISSPGGQLP